jgi:Putative polyhydroxyalkanoic acid system protein (PHA_gran_rgn)
MPELTVSVPHHLSQDQALDRVKARFAQLQQQYSANTSHLQQDWNGNTGSFGFKAMGFDVSGTVVVGPAEVQLQLALPMAANFFKDRIQATIRDDLSRSLA